MKKRVLYYVPIIFHTVEEAGSIGKKIVEMEVRKGGSPKVYQEKAWRYWEKIRQAIKGEKLSTPGMCSKMHIYMDGLPKVPDEHLQNLTKQLIELELPQYLIAEKLIERGATIYGTESIKLLLEERAMYTNMLKGISPDPKRKEELLKERDKFIAEVINETLPKSSFGLLFLGRNHKIVEELDKLEETGKLTSLLKVIYLVKLIYKKGE